MFMLELDTEMSQDSQHAETRMPLGVISEQVTAKFDKIQKQTSRNARQIKHDEVMKKLKE